MERKNKSMSLILLGLFTIVLSNRQAYAAADPNAVAIVAQNIAALVSATNVAQSPWYTSIVEFFYGAQSATIEPVDPLTGIGDVTKKLFQYESAATVFEKAAAAQVGMNLFEDQCLQAWQLAIGGNLEPLRNLLKVGVDVNSIDIENLSETALMAAVCHGSGETVNILLDAGADVNAVNEWGETALMKAAGRGHDAIGNALLNGGADINAINGYGYTALTIASHGGHIEMVKLLLKRGANVNRNTNTRTPLRIASASNRVEIVKELLAAGAYVSDIDAYGKTALDYAILYGYDHIVKLLNNRLNTCKKNIIAPTGLSLPQAFRALYHAFKSIGMGYLDPLYNEPVSDDNHAMQVLLSRCRGKKLFCDYVRGKPIKIDFDQYPELSVALYDKDQGACRAQEVLEKAAYEYKVFKKSSPKNFSRDICDYFDGVQSPDELDVDVRPAFKQCQNLKI